MFAILSGILALAVLVVWFALSTPSPVGEIERVLAPPERWSVSDYGFYGDDGEANLSMINTPERAESMLRLLDRKIGTEQDAWVPDDIGMALEQIRVVSPQLVELPSFRRLETLARRRARNE